MSAQIVLGPVKIRPYAARPAPGGSLVCARNQYCSFQVLVTAQGEDLSSVDVSLSELAGPNRARIPSSQATTYREGFLNVFYRSSAQGDIGEWPDPLIPRVDPEYGETRNAFPFDVRLISPAYKRYHEEKGWALSGGRGWGEAVSGGRYANGLARRYVIEIVQPGRVGAATFRWWSEPGSAQLRPERATSTEPLELDSGVTVAFRGRGSDDDFLTGDEFWIFAGPARNQPVWIDLLIPHGVPAGLYSGDVRVTAAGRPSLRLPVVLEVLGFTLPATTSLANAFVMEWAGLAAAHFPKSHLDPRLNTARTIELGQAYARAALRDEITVTPGESLSPEFTFRPDGGVETADFSAYDRAVSPFLDGRDTPRGARWTSLPLPRYSRLGPAQRSAALREFIAHARQRGWFERLFDYTFDEPKSGKDFAALEERARLVREIEPAIPRLVTTDLNDRLFGLVTRWCPVVNSLERKPGTLRGWWYARFRPRRADYQPRIVAGDSLWWYQSCMSHGCGGMGGSPDFDGWPSYMVDISAVANRVFGLLSVLPYDVSGILYWRVAFASEQARTQERRGLDPWESIYYFGGNGDGTLFYPGRPDQIGGQRHIPIESLRLKMIRDSFYDAEYALLLRGHGDDAFLRQETGRVAQNAWQWNTDPRAWLDLRERLGRRVAAREPGARAATRGQR